MITFIERKGKNIVTAKYDEKLDKLLEYWKNIGTVRKFKDTVYIQYVSFNYSLELLSKWKISFKVITEL